MRNGSSFASQALVILPFMSWRTSRRWIGGIAGVFCGLAAGWLAFAGVRGFVEESRVLIARTRAEAKHKDRAMILCGDGRFALAVVRKEWSASEFLPEPPPSFYRFRPRPPVVEHPAVEGVEATVRRIPSEIEGQFQLPPPRWGFSCGKLCTDWNFVREDTSASSPDRSIPQTIHISLSITSARRKRESWMAGCPMMVGKFSFSCASPTQSLQHSHRPSNGKRSTTAAAAAHHSNFFRCQLCSL